MSSVFKRLEQWTAREWATLGGATVLTITCGGLFEMRRRNKRTAVLEDADCVKRQEIGRYPCQVLHGYDVVVSNHFYKEPEVTEAVTARLRRLLLPIWMQDDADSLNSISRGRVPDEVKGMERNRLSSIRLASTPSGLPVEALASSSPASPRDEDDHHKTSRTLSSDWPPGTNRYCGMTIEPSTPQRAASQGAGSHALAQNRGFLRALVDRSTQQSLVKCSAAVARTAARSTSTEASAAIQHLQCESVADFLSAPYLRTMLAVFGLLPHPLPPLRVCFLGVGGGALPMFIQRYFAPTISRMDLVDVEPQVLTAATELMGLRQLVQSLPLQCYADDAATFLRRVQTGTEHDVGGSTSAGADNFVDESGAPIVSGNRRGSSARAPMYDVIFVDVFVGSETPPHLQTKAFMSSVQQSLSSIGVAAFNLPSADRDFVKDCTDVFGSSNVFVTSCRHSANNVVFAMKRNVNEGMSRRHILRRAQEVAAVYRLPYDVSANFPIWWSIV